MLEAELAKLQAEALLSDQTLPSAENDIFSALAHHLSTSTLPESTIHGSDKTKANGNLSASPPISNSVQENGHTFSPETILPALSAHASLPNFGPAVPLEMQPSSSYETYLSPSRRPDAEAALLPDDMQELFDEHGQTDPQMELPWWLRKIVASSNTPLPDGPIDQESVRTNRLVQRWLERWGRQPSHQQGEDTPHA